MNTEAITEFTKIFEAKIEAITVKKDRVRYMMDNFADADDWTMKQALASIILAHADGLSPKQLAWVKKVAAKAA